MPSTGWVRLAISLQFAARRQTSLVTNPRIDGGFESRKLFARVGGLVQPSLSSGIERHCPHCRLPIVCRHPENSPCNAMHSQRRSRRLRPSLRSLCVGIVCASASRARPAQPTVIGTRAVGGVSIDADGRAEQRPTGRLGRAQQAAQPSAGEDSRRFESGRRDAQDFAPPAGSGASTTASQNNKPLPDADQVSRRPATHSATSSSIPSRRTSCWSGRAKAGRSTPRGTSWASPPAGR